MTTAPVPLNVRVVARVIAQRDRVGDLQTLLVGLLAPTRQEKGCIQYDLLQNNEDPTDFTFVEIWESQADLDAHLASDHLQAAIGQLDGLVIAPPDIRRYSLVG